MNRKRFFFTLIVIWLVTVPHRTGLCRSFWWQPEYKGLIKALDESKGKSLSTAYRAGLGIDQNVKILLHRDPAGSLILRVSLPPETIPRRDDKTGKVIKTVTFPVITIRDHDLDAVPDDFRIVSGRRIQHPKEAQLTEDGFVRIRAEKEYDRIQKKWGLIMGYAVNYFLHGVDSFSPPKP
jgi:hypothetical protein